MSRRFALIVLTASLLLGGCKNRLSGSMVINGQNFTPTSCRNGEALSFYGVELSDAAGARLRLVNMASMQPVVYWMPVGATMPMPLGTCGMLTMNRSNSRVNNVSNVEGTAVLNCQFGAMSATGTVQFGNCH